MEQDKVEWACRLSNDDWQALLKARNRYLIDQAMQDGQVEAKQHLLRLVKTELRGIINGVIRNNPKRDT